MKKNLKKPDVWNSIKSCFTIEWFFISLTGVAGCMGFGYLFYDSWIGGVCLLPGILLLSRGYRIWKEKQKLTKKRIEFKELLYVLSGKLKAGYSMENAWMAAEQDLEIMFSAKSLILKEMQRVTAQLQVKIAMEQAVSEFAQRSQLEEAQSFAEVFSTAKRSGGNLVHMMDKTTAVLTEKMEVEQEIQTMLSGKKLEQKIMCGMPVLMLLYLKLTNAQYIEPLYHNGLGIAIMTACLIGTVIAGWWGSKMIEIEV